MAGTKKLRRSRKNSMIGGVAGGLAEYFEVDVSLIRLGFVILALTGGIGPLLYLGLLLLLPRKPIGIDTEPEKQNTGNTGKSSNYWAILFITAGVILLVNQFVPIGRILGLVFWPAVLILLGVYFITKR